MKADEAELIPWASSMHVEWRTERDDNILDYDTIIEFVVSKFSHDMFKETNHVKSGLGGFQLEFVSVSRVINHMTCYKLEYSHLTTLKIE